MVKLLIVSFLCSLCCLRPASAEQRPKLPQSPAEVLRASQERSAEVDQLVRALRGPDAPLRATTFGKMIESGDPTLIGVAIAEGRASSDDNLRTLAVRAAFREIQSLNVEPASQLSAESKERFVQYTSNPNFLKLDIANFDWKSGKFNGGYALRGQVSGRHISFHSGYCQGDLVAEEGTWSFAGTVNCALNKDFLSERVRVTIR